MLRVELQQALGVLGSLGFPVGTALSEAQIESLNATVAEKDTQLTESEENLAAANAQLAELEATYDAN